MRGIPTSRPAAQASRESLTPEEFAQRASGDEANKFSSVNTETFLRNEYGIRTFGYTSFIVDPPNGQQPALTQAEQARRKAQPQPGTFSNVVLETFDNFSLYDRCISRGVPGSITPVLYGNGFRIVQSPTEVVLTYEMIHETRVIPLDNRPHIAPAHKSWAGDGRGRCEGDTLVVETTNFNARTGGSEKLKLTEWFTRVDPDMIEYKYRIDDADVYVAPFTMRMMLTTQPNYIVMEYSCHEGNSAVSMGLKGERAYEKSVDEAKAKGLPIPAREPRNMDVYRRGASWSRSARDGFRGRVRRGIAAASSASLAGQSWRPQLRRRLLRRIAGLIRHRQYAMIAERGDPHDAEVRRVTAAVLGYPSTGPALVW